MASLVLYAAPVQWLLLSTGIPLILFAVLGAVFGSFGNVLIFRLPAQQSIGGRSHCPHCGRTLRVSELIPVLSYVALRARCAGCRQPIHWQYPLIEAVSALFFVFALFQLHFALIPALLLALALWLLLLIAIIDARTSLIPDALSFSLVLVALAYQVATEGSIDLTGLLVCGGFFAAQWIISRGRWVGSGDILLGGGIGLLVGSWRGALIVLFFAYVIGAAVASILLLSRRKTIDQALPFGPFLVIGGYVAVVFGDFIRTSLFF